ncbi:MAG: DNA alkylation repair protein [Flavisolibacter sp.]
MTAKEILAELKSMGKESIQHVYANHGAPSNHWGVKIGDMKKIQKKVKKDYQLSLELYDSGISDAQYFAGLIADETKMTKKDLQHWADTASWSMVSEYTVAWIAAESAHGWDLAFKWIDSKNESIQTSGWNTLASWVMLKPDDQLDIKELKLLLKRVEKELHNSTDRVKYAMNSFLIAAGAYVKELTPEAQRIAKAIGKFTIDMGDTACKVPYALEYIQKVIDRGAKKKKMARC